MLTAANHRTGNNLLNALPADEYRELLPNLKHVEMPLGKIIYDVGEPIDYIYFPENSIISTVSCFEDGACIETGITGREGMIGISLALSNDSAPRETSVQASGYGWQMPAKKFQDVFDRGGKLHYLVLRYVYAFLEQVAQSGACINHHPVNQRLARWMLMCHDRTEGDELRITHDFIAQMLGVNRPSVTGAAIELKDAGLIKYSRGLVQITDRAGLESFTCECYGLIKRIYDQYLSMLELRQLNQKMEHVSNAMSAEMKRREALQSVTVNRIQNLRNAVSDIKNPPIRIRICRNCQKFCDFRNNPKSANEYLGKRVDAEFVSVVCSVCDRQQNGKAG